MKRKKIWSFILVVLLLIGVAIILYFINKRQGYRIEVTEISNCKNIPEIYISESNRNIYTYCLDSITVYDSRKKIELKDYLEYNNLKIDDVTYRLPKKDSYWDGGSIIYRSNGHSMLSKSGISILKCKTIDGNTDVYIGPKNMEYEDSFCQTLTDEEKFYQNVSLSITPIPKLPESFTIDDALKENTSYIRNNTFYHQEIYQQFLDNYKNKKDAFFRFIKTTDEGDMIIEDIKYNSDTNTIFILTDTTRDKYAVSEDRKITLRQFEKLEEATTNDENGGKYKLSAFQGSEEYVILSHSLFID